MYAWCIMSNHVYLAAAAKNNDLSDVLRDFKKFTSKQIIKAIEESKTESRKEWMLAVFKNAGALVEEGVVDKAEEYIYSSARDYYYGKKMVYWKLNGFGRKNPELQTQDSISFMYSHSHDSIVTRTIALKGHEPWHWEQKLIPLL